MVGLCEPEVDPNSCAGICGQTAPGGCSCDPSCVANGDCCADYAAACPVCTPNCAGRNCGDDGCGGSCGTCTDPILNTCEPTAGRCIDPQCVPDCLGATCGDDGCGGSCGTCPAGDVCFEGARSCAPQGWACDPFLIGDGLCDCGCGLLDPDCSVGGNPQGIGCPLGVACDPAGATCQGTTCRSPGACGAGELCVGAVYESGRRLTGLCEVKSPSGMGGAGSPCLFGDECDSGLCAYGTCADHCVDDAGCGGGTLCLGLEDEISPRTSPDGVSIASWIAACAQPPGSGTVCTTDADCPTPGEACLTFIDGDTLGARALCAVLDTSAVSQPCGTAMAPVPGSGLCPPGLFCTDAASTIEPVCARPCPNGVSDCGAGETCTTITINDQNTTSTQDDVLLPVCVP